MQNDGHHLPIVDQHRVFTNLLKILEIWIMSLVFLWRRGRDAHAYYLTHGVRDTMPGSTKMSDNTSTFLGPPMLGEAQFCVPNNNRYQIMRNAFTIHLKKEKKPEISQKALTILEVEVPPSQGYRTRPRPLRLHIGLSSPKAWAPPTAQLRVVSDVDPAKNIP